MTGYVIVNITLGKVAGFGCVYTRLDLAQSEAARIAAGSRNIFRIMALTEVQP